MMPYFQIETFDKLAVEIFLPLVLLYSLLGIDDMFIDLYYWLCGLRHEFLTKAQLETIATKPEKKIAIMIASWKEDNVLRAMVAGNVRRLEYQNYEFFLGVYPNDAHTTGIAEGLAKQFSNVRVVINRLPGPTSKGQMINEIVRNILATEILEGTRYDAIMIHDCEDVLHQKSLKVVNHLLDTHDFIQVPIFSLPVPLSNLVAGGYMDEFAESHTKDLLVRNATVNSVPSAGVGTAISRRHVLAVLKENDGEFLNSATLTEDYELGTSGWKYGSRAKFACYQFENAKGEREFIATRAYFPKAFVRSVRQKSRWTLGIAFQGAEHLGWEGSLLQKYFLFRDRKGPAANVLVLFGGAVFTYSLLRWGFDSHYLQSVRTTLISSRIPIQIIDTLVFFNFFLMINRIAQRMICTNRVYGLQFALLAPARLIIANVINAFASIKATRQYIESKITGAAPKWIKTEHELPVGFGLEADLAEPTLPALAQPRALNPETIMSGIEFVEADHLDAIVSSTSEPSTEVKNKITTAQ